MRDSYPTWPLVASKLSTASTFNVIPAAAYLNSGTALVLNLLRYLPSNTRYLRVTAFVSSAISSNRHHDDIIVGRDR